MPLKLRGIIVPLATPLTSSPNASPNVDLDVDALERMIEHVIAGGVSGIFLLGTTGEFPSLSRWTREEIVRRACARVAGRVPVLVGITDTALTEALRFADVAAESRAQAVVLAAPYYYEHSQEELLGFLEMASQRLALPLWLYNIPQLTKNSFEPETVRRAADLPGVMGIKDSTGDLEYLARTIELLDDRPDFTVLVGPEELLAEAIRMGAHGGVCGGANLNPRLFVELYEAALSNDAERAARLQQRVMAMGRALYSTGHAGASYLRGIKAAMALAGLCRPEAAPPYLPFTEAEYAEIAEGYRSLRERYPK